MKRQRLGNKGFGLVSLGFLVIISTATAGDLHGDDTQGELRITVRVQDYAQTPPKVLDRGERRAAAILRKAGIESDWVNCTGDGLSSEPECLEPMRATDLILRILPPSMSELMPLSGDTIGFAVVSTKRHRSSLASIFYRRVEDLWLNLGYSRAVSLGYAMAHEIGHLLLGTLGHSSRGIMCFPWEPEHFLLPLRFNSAQAELIRADVQARIEMRGAEETVVIASQDSPQQ